MAEEQENGKMRGFSTTISTIILLSALLYFVNSIAHYSNLIADSGQEAAKIGAVSSSFDAAAYGMKKIALYEGMNISVVGTSITFKQDMSNNSIRRYRNSLAAWKSLNEDTATFQTTATIHVDDARVSRMNITPQDITVASCEGWYPGSSNNLTMRITPANYRTVTGYVASLNYTNLGNLSITNKSFSDNGPNSLYFKLNAGISSWNGTLNRSQTSSFCINNSGQCVAAVQIYPNSILYQNALRVDINSSQNNLNLTVILQLNGSVDSVELGNDAVSVEGDGIIKKGKVLLWTKG